MGKEKKCPVTGMASKQAPGKGRTNQDIGGPIN